MLIKNFWVEGICMVGVGAKSHVIVRSPSRLWFCASFRLVVFDAVEDEG